MLKRVRRSSSKESLLRLLIACLMVFGITLITSGCSCTNEEIPEDFRVLSVREIYPQALKEAEEWKDDAYLNILGLWVIPNDYDDVLHAYFGFETSDSSEWFSIEFVGSENNIKIKSKDSGVYPSNLDKPEIDLDMITLDSTEAFKQIFQKEGNKLFERHPDVIYPIILYLNRHGYEYVKWVASFETRDGISWTITMDAKTNEITEVKVIDE